MSSFHVSKLTIRNPHPCALCKSKGRPCIIYCFKTIIETSSYLELAIPACLGCTLDRKKCSHLNNDMTLGLKYIYRLYYIKASHSFTTDPSSPGQKVPSFDPIGPNHTKKRSTCSQHLSRILEGLQTRLDLLKNSMYTAKYKVTDKEVSRAYMTQADDLVGRTTCSKSHILQEEKPSHTQHQSYDQDWICSYTCQSHHPGESNACH